jgi:hypothetical protein
VDAIAFRFQCRTNEAPNLAVVLDDQQLRNGFDRSAAVKGPGRLHAVYTRRPNMYANYTRDGITCSHCNGVEIRVNVYLFGVLLRSLVATVMLLLLVSVAALAARRQRRRLGKRSEALVPYLAASGAGSESAPSRECHAGDGAEVKSSPVVFDHRAQRRAA